MHSMSTLSHRKYYMNHMSMTCRFILDFLGPQWAIGATLFPTYYVISRRYGPQCHPYEDLAIQGTVCPHWAVGAIVYQSNIYLVIPDILCPQWVLGATIWTTCRSSYFRAFWVSSEPWEPVFIYIYILLTCRYCHFWAFWIPCEQLFHAQANLVIQMSYMPNKPWETLYIKVIYI